MPLSVFGEAVQELERAVELGDFAGVYRQGVVFSDKEDAVNLRVL